MRRNNTIRERLQATAQLTVASTAIAAASVYVAGASAEDAIIYDLLTGLTLLVFWNGLIYGFKPSLSDLHETSGAYEISVAKQGETGPLRQ